jgi:hypothetical protein
MPGRPNRSRARPGEPACPSCGRRAGLGTDHPGEDLCRRCGGGAGRGRHEPAAVEHRDRTDERAAGMGVILLACARQGFLFVDAWRVVLEFALHDLPPSRQAATAARLAEKRTRLERSYGREVERHAAHGSGHVSDDRASAPTR